MWKNSRPSGVAVSMFCVFCALRRYVPYGNDWLCLKAILPDERHITFA
jgi:hypothetical protein